ncbi:MAG TPA: hypothetical protein VFQ53_30345 [Kofleriaceae bacterium]|nr:hypothetical protein [Kofleriaceae bacterium]
MIALCPDCPPARAARSWFFDEAFGIRLVEALLPFAITLALVWLLARYVAKGDS